MKKEVFKVKLSEAISSYLESFQFEIDGWCHLCRWVQTIDKPMKWKMDELEYYQQKRNEAEYCKSVVFDEIIKDYVPERFKGEQFEIGVDFDRQEATIYENE
ncbi:MAG: hypothetical protein IJJ55_06120 [Clostridia bacterium]|nr:hypothetical protein [Clostridia bacterium]